MEIQRFRVPASMPSRYEDGVAHGAEALPNIDRGTKNSGSGAMKLTASNVNINANEFPHQTAVGDGIPATKDFEFVTLTGVPSKATLNEISKKVRTHAMRDYLRRQNQEIMTGVVEAPKVVTTEEPSQYKTRFKLDSWTHKTRTRALNERQAKAALTRAKTQKLDSKEESSNRRVGNSLKVNVNMPLPSPLLVALSNDLDPFDTLSLKLGPLSQRLLVHYNTAYFMNSVAINAEGDFFSFVKTDPALFHSILYLVALHYNLKLGLVDSPECLYHGSEAFRLINQRLDDPTATFSDMTLAAVAMLANKENLDGKYELSKMHMRGLEFMIRSRGGIHKFSGVFQRIITWSDFCFANAWSCQSSLPRLPLNTSSQSPMTTDLTYLKASHIFGSQSPIVPIIHLIRKLSSDLSPSNFQTVNRLDASTNIYHLEYSLLLLNKARIGDEEPLECVYSFEVVPLKTAVHLWLWLAIRELPPTSALLYTLMKRLQDSLEVQLPGWWNSSGERRLWLLWILFVGCVASAGREERIWFVIELRLVCQQIGIDSQELLKQSLMTVLWQEAFCAGVCAVIWNEINFDKCMEGSILAHI